jgi:hypothetical protein
MQKDKFVLLTVSQEPGKESRIVAVNVVEVPHGSRFVTLTMEPVRVASRE